MKRLARYADKYADNKSDVLTSDKTGSASAHTVAKRVAPDKLSLKPGQTHAFTLSEELLLDEAAMSATPPITPLPQFEEVMAQKRNKIANE